MMSLHSASHDSGYDLLQRSQVASQTLDFTV